MQMPISFASSVLECENEGLGISRSGSGKWYSHVVKPVKACLRARLDGGRHRCAFGRALHEVGLASVSQQFRAREGRTLYDRAICRNGRRLGANPKVTGGATATAHVRARARNGKSLF